MRKTFLTFCTAALALLAVSSCGKIWDEFDAVHGEIDDLKAKLEALEAKLNEQVSGLNNRINALETFQGTASETIASLVADLDALDGAIDGRVSDLEAAVQALQGELGQKYQELKGADADLLAALTQVAVTKVEKKENGNVVLHFADGTSVELPSNANASNEGFVTVVDGKWAVVGADGETTVLDAEVHPDTELTFKVDPETKELLYSLDGETYEPTGAYVSDEQFSVITGVVEGDDVVTITIGGVEYSFPKATTNTFDIVSGKVFFQSYETKSVPVAMKGVVSSMVANAPAGWSVKLTNGGLTVTAPGASLDDWGDLVADNPEDEVAGVIEVWVVTEDGKTFVGKLGVTLASQSDYAVITVTEKSNVRIDVGSAFCMGDFYYGVCKLEDYDPEALNTAIAGIMDYENMPAGVNRFFDLTYGDEPWLETTIADILGSEMEFGATYVVWGYCYETGYDPMTWTRTVISTANDFIAVYVTPTAVDFEAVQSWNDADLKVSVKGAQKYYATFMDSEMYAMYAPMLEPESLAEMGMSLLDALSNMGMGTYYTEDYEGPLSQFGLGEENLDYAQPLYAGTEYKVIVLPIEPYKNDSDYTVADLVVNTVKTDDLTYGGTGVVTFGEPEVSFSTFNIAINSTALMTVYSMWTTEEYEALAAEMPAGETMGDYLMLNYADLEMFEGASTTAYFGSYPALTPGTSYTLAAIAIDADGKCSDVVTKVVETLPVPYDENVTVTFESIDNTTPAKTVITFNVTGGANKVCVKVASRATSFESTVLQYGVNASYYGYTWANVVDGKATVTVNTSYNKNIGVIAYTVTDGALTAISQQVNQTIE